MQFLQVLIPSNHLPVKCLTTGRIRCHVHLHRRHLLHLHILQTIISTYWRRSLAARHTPDKLNRIQVFYANFDDFPVPLSHLSHLVFTALPNARYYNKIWTCLFAKNAETENKICTQKRTRWLKRVNDKKKYLKNHLRLLQMHKFYRSLPQFEDAARLNCQTVLAKTKKVKRLNVLTFI